MNIAWIEFPVFVQFPFPMPLGKFSTRGLKWRLCLLFPLVLLPGLEDVLKATKILKLLISTVI